MSKSQARGALGVPEMLRGSVVTHRRRCGKPNCRCASGEELHESVVLSYSKASRTRFVMLEPEEVDAVRAIAIADNAKTQRYSPCNTMETLLVHAGIAARVLPPLAAIYAAKGVEMRGCERARS